MELYWLLRLPALHDVFLLLVPLTTIFACLLCFGALFAHFLALTLLYNETESIYTRFWWKVHIAGRWVVGLAFVFAFLSVLCPSRQDLAIMLGWDAIKSDSVQEVIEILKEKIR